MNTRYPTIARISVLCALMVLAACGSPSQSTRDTSTSGVQGVARVDGGCPVSVNATPCPDRPLRAHVIVTRPGSDTALASVDTDAQGRFKITLNPGQYVLQATNMTGGLLPASSPHRVSVSADRFTSVRIEFDSGIR